MCIEEVNRAYAFKKQCIKNDIALRESICKTETEDDCKIEIENTCKTEVGNICKNEIENREESELDNSFEYGILDDSSEDDVNKKSRKRRKSRKTIGWYII